LITCQYAAVGDSHDEADNRTNNNVYDGDKYRNPEDGEIGPNLGADAADAAAY